MDPVNIDGLEILKFASSTTDDGYWKGGFFAYGGADTDNSTVIYFTVPAGKRLGRHTAPTPPRRRPSPAAATCCATTAPSRSRPATSSS